MIHIQISFDTMLKRIKKRGRPYEQLDADPSLYDYYKQLNERYQKWYEDYDESPKMSINGDRYDFVEDPQASREVLAQIDRKLESLGLK